MMRRYRRIKTNPNGTYQRTTATALRYDSEKDNAPEVIASGKGKIAEQIIALGRENKIPIYDDPILAAALADVDPGNEIPPELYTLVAQVLAFIYRTYRMNSSSSKK
jgi:flagellar biosynthesis protein